MILHVRRNFFEITTYPNKFRQHDGVVTMMMFYRRRASPKHRYDIIEVDYGGEGHPIDTTIDLLIS